MKLCILWTNNSNVLFAMYGIILYTVIIQRPIIDGPSPHNLSQAESIVRMRFRSKAEGDIAFWEVCCDHCKVRTRIVIVLSYSFCASCRRI